ncbi:Aste57867_1221 [Aphanomyces stellatus]|uniref:Aste57867_1221 protein n=1 Tax=Aphanomyces stellatus TaxID=120398 RepID=A0A485K5Q9_9STRA|nr:hypothetical protein As57867_001220 [Aphanomyces stellatus]VFT78441.1 Aste57867_1221 [Aphanomyces stellatus]
MDFSVSFLENLYASEIIGDASNDVTMEGAPRETATPASIDAPPSPTKSPLGTTPQTPKRLLPARTPSPQKRVRVARPSPITTTPTNESTPRRRSPRKHPASTPSGESHAVMQPPSARKALQMTTGPELSTALPNDSVGSPSTEAHHAGVGSTSQPATPNNSCTAHPDVPAKSPSIEPHLGNIPPLTRQQINCARHLVLTTQPLESAWTGLDAYVVDVQRALERTIVFGENQSALLVGSAGNGKRAIVDKALAQLKATHAASAVFHPIFLSGSVFLNETEAFREIVQQLVPDGIVGQRSISFFNMYDFLKQLLLEKALAEEAVLFIVDDFDAFVGETKQLLLYNLLDWMQSKDVRIGFLGLSCNFNVLAQFEKRVKSRFSNIQIVIARHPLKTILQLLWIAFQLPRDRWPSHVPPPPDSFFDTWESSLHHVLFDSIEHQHHWQYLYDMGKPVQVFLRLMHIAMLSLTTEMPYVGETHLQHAWDTMFPCHAMHALRGLTTREMTLVLGMIGLERQGKVQYSFEMVYFECKAFYRQNALKSPPRIDLVKALDNLLALHVVQETSHQPQPEYRMVKLLLRPSEVLDAIRKKHIACTTFVEQWATNTLH